jgi:hypothetical protein
MHQVGHKKIGIEILGGLEKRKCGISQDSAVLPYESKRKLFVVLIIPPAMTAQPSPMRNPSTVAPAPDIRISSD